jgi:DNA mismatch repair ATPase MutS
MKAHLLYQDRDFDLQRKPAAHEQALKQDLELDTLFTAMAHGDKFTYDVVAKVVLSSLVEPEAIVYRQAVLRDCLKNPSVVRGMYDLAVEAIESERKKFWGILRDHPSAILRRSVEVLQMFVDMLKRLRTMADEHSDAFTSAGFVRLFAMLKQELGDDYFGVVQDHLRQLQFRNGVWISADLGEGNKGANYVLRKPNVPKGNRVQQIFARKPPAYTFHIAPRDDSGARALSELEDRGINLVANALAQSNDHILSFFVMLRTELAFYIGCLNLAEQLAQMGAPIAFPQPVGSRERRYTHSGLYDVCLALTMKHSIVGNDVNADSKDLVIITGANQGGKSTYLRSVGLAQLMMQSGMFVPAESFCGSVCDRLFTHYRREEDASMRSGKLDEELSRMSEIVDNIAPNSMVLFNESFAATNEREGSEIAGQIVRALVERGIRVFFVTHLYEFARRVYDRQSENVLFLRAERQADGVRTFKLVKGMPLQTSYGPDLYTELFGEQTVESAAGDDVRTSR